MHMENKKAGRPPKKANAYKKLRAVYLTDEQYKRCLRAAGDRMFSQWAAETLLRATDVDQ